MGKKFEEGFGAPARSWPLGVGGAVCLELDTILIAGTGEGKTIPYMLPPLRNTKHKALILSPLKVLQEDQVRRFKKMGIDAAAVNGDTWSPELQRVRHEYRRLYVLLTGFRCSRTGKFKPSLHPRRCVSSIQSSVPTSARLPRPKGSAWSFSVRRIASRRRRIPQRLCQPQPSPRIFPYQCSILSRIRNTDARRPS